jgi:GNAT superfamily N-acetyltransferase
MPVTRRGLLRRATEADLPRLFEIWTAVDEHRLLVGWQQFMVTARRLMASGPVWVWANEYGVQGFGAYNVETGEIEALYVEPRAQGRGIGRALLHKCCDGLIRRGHRHAWLVTSPGTRAERIYRDAGWAEAGTEPSGAVRLRRRLAG